MATIEKNTAADGSVTYAVRYRKPDGKTTRRRGFPTKRDANAFAATTETSKLRGEFVSASVGKTTVGELGPAWLERQRGHLKPTTAYAYERTWRVMIEPRWGRVRIGSIKPSDVQSWLSDLSNDHGTSGVRQAHNVFALILDDAVKDRMLIVNPARGAKLPDKTPRRNIYLTRPQLRMLAVESGEYGSLILLLGVGGLRWSEAVGLRPCDVDFLRRRVELHRNTVQIGGTFHVGSLKSNENRAVVLPEFVTDAIAASCQGKGRDDLIWTAAKGGYLRRTSKGDTWFHRAVVRCQQLDPEFPRITPHKLRNTAASLAVQSGAHVKAIQRMLGHANASMTLDVYADLFESDLDAVAESVSRMWELDA